VSEASVWEKSACSQGKTEEFAIRHPAPLRPEQALGSANRPRTVPAHSLGKVREESVCSQGKTEEFAIRHPAPLRPEPALGSANRPRTPRFGEPPANRELYRHIPWEKSGNRGPIPGEPRNGRGDTAPYPSVGLYV